MDFYKVTFKGFKAFETCYCRTENDIIDIINSPEYGPIWRIETISVPDEGAYSYGGPE